MTNAGRWLLLLVLLLAACSEDSPTPAPPPPPPTAAPTVAPTAPPPVPTVPTSGKAPASTGGPMATAGGVPMGAGDAEKIDSVFYELLNVYRTQGQDAAVRFARDQGLLNAKNEVRATLLLDSDERAVADNVALNVTRLGGRVTASNGVEMEIVVPVQTVVLYAQTHNQQQFFTDVAQFQHVRNVRRTPQPTIGAPTAGGVESSAAPAPLADDEGIAAMGADKWQAAGLTGKGVKVGVVDSAFNRYQRVLPAGTAVKTASFRSDSVIEDETTNAGTLHGTACAEIVAKMAPQVQLVLVTVDSQGSFAQALNYLVRTERVAVITTSVGWSVPEKNGRSVAAVAVDGAREAGVFVTVAAGNSASGQIGSAYADAHLAQTFVDSDRNGFHDFPGARGKNDLQMATAGGAISLYLYWADYNRPHVDYDLLIVDASNTTVARSTEKQGRTGRLPEESILETLPKGTYTLRIRKVNAGDPDLPFDLYLHGAQFEITTPMGSIATPADARGAFTVGAADWRTAAVEAYSSYGPTRDGRTKPDISAPTNTTSEANALVGRRSFGGTSGATPHAAGAVALYRQAFPKATADEIARFFTERATRPGGDRTGKDVAGAGVIALGAVPAGATTAPFPAAVPLPRPATSNGFADDFRNPASGLPTAGYENGAYRIRAAAGQTLLAGYGQNFAAPRTAYSVTARRGMGPDDAEMGLLVRQRDRDNYLAFVVLSDGTAGALARVNGTLQVLGDPVRSPAVRRDGPNELRVVAEGEQFTFSVNGQTVLSVPLSGVWADGAYGLVAGGGETAAAEIVFAQFAVMPG